MRRNNLGLILVASLAIGCNAPSAKEVYVDLDAVLAADTLPVPAASDFGAPPSGKAAQTVRMEGREGREFAVKRPQREEDVRELLRESRREARQRIQRELEKLYLLNVENARDRMLRDLEPSRREAFERAMEQVRAIFEPYAQERGRVLAELTSLVGFPDPDPESKIEPTIKGPIMRERFEEAKRLRAELKALEANYNGQVAGLLQGARSRSDELLTEALLRVQEMQAQAVERAESEARQAVSDVER